MTESGLRSCPLCQGEAIGIDHPAHTHFIATFMPDHPGSYTIECPRCNLGLLANTEELAKSAWNSRVQPEAALATLGAEVRELREDAKRYRWITNNQSDACALVDSWDMEGASAEELDDAIDAYIEHAAAMNEAPVEKEKGQQG